MTARRLTTRQLAAALAAIDAQIAGLAAVLATFDSHFAPGTPATATAALPDEVADAWNAAHDAIRMLTDHRDRVAINPHPMPAAGQGTWELIQQNID